MSVPEAYSPGEHTQQMLHAGPAALHQEHQTADQVMMPPDQLNNLDLSTLFDDVDHLL